MDIKVPHVFYVWLLSTVDVMQGLREIAEEINAKFNACCMQEHHKCAVILLLRERHERRA